MIDIGTTDFYFSLPNLSKRQLEKYSLDLFDRWEQSVERGLLLPDYSLSLEVEEGSIKGRGKIAAGLAAIYVGVSNYGSFISGIQIIQGQANSVGDLLAEAAKERFLPNLGAVKVRKRGETLGSLQRLFVKVQRGDITPDQATKEAELLIGEDVKDSPEFVQTLGEELAQAPKYHEQIPLPIEDINKTPQELKLKKKQLPRAPSPPPRPLPSHFRIEVWKGSKKQKKNYRVIDI